ncbi:MAG: hypothetical protein AMJ53_11810 [Gammaproteobacteria bacterium SG8_11]|nr:MAG: hypothetical protein AMJ53_11810 [Gammaproteobacteria bacterium SG8_11]
MKMPVYEVGLELGIEWESADASHKDRYVFSEFDIEHADIPASLREDLTGLGPGDTLSQTYPPGELVAPYDTSNIRQIQKADFRTRFSVALHPGRFYPRKFIATALQGSQNDNRPFRLLSVDGDMLQIDLNHPLSLRPIDLTATVLAPLQSGGNAPAQQDMIAALCDSGPGLQANSPEITTEFITDSAFRRSDTQDDAEFYQQPRLVAHLDETALDQFKDLYTRFVKPGMKVLDLMSSWKSHLPEDVAPLHVTGLGMNVEEMRGNTQLNDYVVFDLNQSAELPFAPQQFDLAICTVSVEYLINPFNVFQQVARALKPGAAFVVSFSERWFPPKVVQVWTELHPFERMGLVLEYFRQAKAFSRLATESLRGLPRPPNDKYAQAMSYSDPLYAVWGYAKP